MKKRITSTFFTAPELSPSFLFKFFCGALIGVNAIRYQASTEKMSDNEDMITKLGTILSLRYMFSSARQIGRNYDDFRRATTLLEQYGYKKRWARHFIGTTCGRAQLRRACRKAGESSKFHRHIKDKGIRFWHIGGESQGERLIPVNIFITGALAGGSSYRAWRNPNTTMSPGNNPLAKGLTK